MNAQRNWTRGGAVLVVVVCCLLVFTTADAQSKKSAKQTESLEKAGDSAQEAVQDVLNDLRDLLTGYNSIISGEAKDPQSAYNKLVNNYKGIEKSIDGAKKQLAALNKEADKFFKAWEQDLANISSDSVREKSSNRMEVAKKRYAAIGETLTKARAELAPVVQNLNDQILYLGRDLSPEAVADLQDEAEELNQQAKEVAAKVKEMLQSAEKAQDEAEAELEGEGE
jgi:DNA-binding ferritin-like protein